MDMARGAQIYARALCDQLDRTEEPHLVVTLFSAPPLALRPDVCLGVPAGRWRSAGLDPRALARLARWLRARPLRAVVAHGGEPYKYAALAAPRGVPILYYRIGAILPSAGRPPARWWHTALLRRAGRVVSVSDDIRTETAKLFKLPGTRLLTIPNGRDPDIYSPGPPGPRSNFVVGFVGKLVESKQPGRVIDAVAALRRDGIAAEGVIAGDGPMHDRLRTRCRGSGVRVVGRCTEVPALLRTFDVLLFPSRREGEGMPGVIIEAGLSGVPVVATDAPGVRDVVASGETGFVVPIDDLQEMIRKLRTLAEQPDLRQRMGQAGRNRCTSRFSMAASASAWRDLLDQVAHLPDPVPDR